MDMTTGMLESMIRFSGLVCVSRRTLAECKPFHRDITRHERTVTVHRTFCVTDEDIEGLREKLKQTIRSLESSRSRTSHEDLQSPGLVQATRLA